MKPSFKLYLVTDGSKPDEILRKSQQALEGGARAIQLREKSMNVRQLIELAKALREMTNRFQSALFINDRADVALAVKADGVHLGQDSLTVNAVRKIAGDRLLIGVSTHGIDEAVSADADGADFITLGPVFETPSKTKYGLPLGTETLKEVCKRASIPVFAIGGVKTHNVLDVMTAGAYGVALISGIFSATDIKEATKEYMRITT